MNEFTKFFLCLEYVRVLLPCASLNLIAVKIIHQAVFVCWKRFVAPVDIHALAATVVHTAVAVPTLSDCSSGLWHQPCVCPCAQKLNHLLKLKSAPLSLIFSLFIKSALPLHNNQSVRM